MWAQVGVILPDHVRTTYDHVMAFHESVIQNRRIHLEREQRLAEERIADRQRQRALDLSGAVRSWKSSSSGGALEQLILLESEHSARGPTSETSNVVTNSPSESRH